MLNTTIISLSALSLISSSPFYMISNKRGQYIQTSFYNSYFSHYFSNFIAAYTTNHKTIINNCIFSHTLSSAVKFSKEKPDTCYFDPGKPIGGQTINGDMFEDEDHRPYFEGNCGDIIMTGCIFIKCYSQNPGGSVYICQDCSAILHNTIFDNSYTSSNAGGAVFAAGGKNGGPPNFNNDQMTYLDIQYCCFQNCQSNSGLYGVAVFSAAVNNILYYASTVDSPGLKGESEGAQFDLQAKNVTSQYVNSTGTNSNFCGGIEYRHASDGFFRFQTISDMICMFAVSYTQISIKSLELEISNIINITLRRGQFNDENVYSGLVHVRNSDKIIMSRFSFIDNNLEDKPFEKENDNRIFTDYQRIISRGHAGGGNLQTMNVKLIGCYFDCSYDKVILTNGVEISYDDCHENANADGLNNIEQLDLGDCKGKVTAAPLTPTYYFTDSKEFSKSKAFLKTDAFSNSDYFTFTNGFSSSFYFSESEYLLSKEMTKTKTKEFTKTDHFSKSKYFTLLNGFTVSKIPIFIPPNNAEQNNKSKTGMIAGIVCGVVANAAIIALIAFFIIKKKRSNIIDEEEIETLDDSNDKIKSVNPLFDKEAEDDPFKEDFH